MGDRECIPELLTRLQTESDYGQQIAYASALGKLHASEATDALLALLQGADDEITQLELALAVARTVARTVGDEHYFIQLLRQTRGERGTALAQALVALRRKVSQLTKEEPQALAALDAACDLLARNNLTAGVQQLETLVQHLPLTNFPVPAASVLRACASELNVSGAGRIEYLILVLYTLHAVEVADFSSVKRNA